MRFRNVTNKPSLNTKYVCKYMHTYTHIFYLKKGVKVLFCILKFYFYKTKIKKMIWNKLQVINF